MSSESTTGGSSQQLKEEQSITDDDTIDWSKESIKRYFLTRFPSLFEIHLENTKYLNPVPALRKVTLRNWNYFFMGMAAWFSASFDFFITAVCATQISESLDVTTEQITWGLSAVLMLRSSGAIIFGYWTDKSSRKWPFITTCALFCVLQLATGFVKTYQQFLAVRALSGIAMGGTYGTAAATSLEDAPVEARSFLSGLFFAAYPFGLIFAAIFWKAFQNTAETWKSVFFFSAGIPFLLIIWRLCFPETEFFTRVLKARVLIKEDELKNGTYHKLTIKEHLAQTKIAISKYWVLFVYLVLLMSAPNYLIHAAQDLFPTFLRKQVELSENLITITVVVTNLGGVIGAVVVGSAMEVLGRRLSLMICCICGGAFLYPAFMVHASGSTIPGGFFLYFFVIGIWGIIPAHLSELSPQDSRVFISGLAYQLGNLAASASSTIETQLAHNWPVGFDADGNPDKYNYGKVMAILTGAVFIYCLFITFVGHEKFHRNLSSPLMTDYIDKVIANETSDEEKFSFDDSEGLNKKKEKDSD
jgi:SHS family lactate transporter-like MFS transporter